MGIRHLETFVRQEVPNGYFKINIEDEIRKYYTTSKSTKPAAPVIVVDLMSLYQPVSKRDLAGLLCGGRYNQVEFLLNQFYTRLKGLDVSLVFYYDGPVQQTKYDTWTKRQDNKYQDMIKITDAVKSMDLRDIVMRFQASIPSCTTYPVKSLAKKYGSLKTSIERECDQELAAYANAVHAIAVISNDTDFMIFEGTWRYWSSKDLNLETLTTYEYNRAALVNHLQLTYKQMPLFATLGGNDIVQYDEVRRFHNMLNPRQMPKFYKLANFVRQCSRGESLQSVLSRAFGRAAVNDDLMYRFQKSLEFYDTNYPASSLNPTDDPVIERIKNLEDTFVYQIYIGKSVNLTGFFLDMRPAELGARFPQMALQIVLRQAGIIQYHRQMLPGCSTCSVVLKLNHDIGYSLQEYPVEFPPNITPPPMLDLLSADPDVCASLYETKMRLLVWIVSSTLDHQQIQRIPKAFRLTVVTIYYLLENRMFKLFEADLLLRVAYDVHFSTYNFQQIPYPKKLNIRAFHVAFIFIKFFTHFVRVLRLLRLEEDGIEENPLYDGFLFHNMYADWQQGLNDLDHIQEWRIYKALG
ncbi:constitutive coactivator of PPAR-gamma-like protein 1 [Topomyia yanbarensis]|uniref:constitutive coactivator of PPAR-gamma-like protein 1 n=1 Tax=Topomyia yanbarensis TaxID=2498891 RepID=UPI00273A9B7C|nr:constitutive coactivator of PPAR-gamma-like protein 1 [Topomyia yanbarensis]